MKHARRSREQEAVDAGLVVAGAYARFLASGTIEPGNPDWWEVLCLESHVRTDRELREFRRAIKRAIQRGEIAVVEHEHKQGDGLRLMNALGPRWID